MQFTLAFAGLLATAVSAVCGAALEARAPLVHDGNLFVCTDKNFTGTCENYEFYAQACSNFPPKFSGTISSLGPDAGWTCQVFKNTNCNNGNGILTVVNPGYADLSTIGWDNSINSFQCFRS